MRKNTKHSQINGQDVRSYRFTDPVVRVVGQKPKGKPGPRSKSRAGQDSGAQRRVAVFHKRQEKGDDADIISTRDVKAWKKSSGRSKSWKACKRVKITQNYLELLTNSSGHPVSFGWQFSTLATPTLFVKGQRVHINKEPKTQRRKTSPANSAMKSLTKDDLWVVPSPRGRPRNGQALRREREGQNASAAMPKRFFRVFLGPNTFITTEEASPTFLSLTARPCPPAQTAERQSSIGLEHFAVLGMVCNDTQADIYSLRQLSQPSLLYQAHAFLSQGFGNNWLKYRQRKIDRLRKSKDFQAETIQFSKHILVMKAVSEAEDVLQIKYTQQEFPSLSRIGAKPHKPAQKKFRRSYAAVVKEGPCSKKKPKSNHLAHRAWQERHGIRKPKDESRTKPKGVMNRAAPEFDDFILVSSRKSQPKIHPINRLAMVQCPSVQVAS